MADPVLGASEETRVFTRVLSRRYGFYTLGVLAFILGLGVL